MEGHHNHPGLTLPLVERFTGITSCMCIKVFWKVILSEVTNVRVKTGNNKCKINTLHESQVLVFVKTHFRTPVIKFSFYINEFLCNH